MGQITAVAWVWFLARELLHAMGVAKRKIKKKTGELSLSADNVSKRKSVDLLAA